MAYSDLLINTCTIKKLVQAGADAYGNPNVSWNDVADVACRVSTPTGKEIKIGAEVVIADYKLFLEDDDIDEQDRVELVVDGVTVTYEVLLVTRRQNGAGTHHRECYLRTVR